MKEKSPLTSKTLYVVGFPRHPWVYGDDSTPTRGKAAFIDCFTSYKEAKEYLLKNMQSEGRKCNIYKLEKVDGIAA